MRKKLVLTAILALAGCASDGPRGLMSGNVESRAKKEKTPEEKTLEHYGEPVPAPKEKE